MVDTVVVTWRSKSCDTDLVDALGNVEVAFKELKRSSVDEDALLADLELLKTILFELRRDIGKVAAAHADLCRRLKTPGDESRFFNALRNDAESTGQMSRDICQSLQRGRQILEIAADAAESLNKITSGRSLLGRLHDASKARKMSQALTSCSVAYEKIAVQAPLLADNLETLQRRGVFDWVRFHDHVPDEDSSEGQDEPTGPMSERSPTDSTKVGPSLPPRGIRSPSPEELRLAVASLERWSRHYPLALRRPSKSLRILSAEFSPIVYVRVQSLWGERARETREVPYNGQVVDGTRVSSLWMLPAAPPDEIRAGEEATRRVPGEETLVDCRACARKPDPDCSLCGGSRRVIQYCDYKTSYRTSTTFISRSDADETRRLLWLPGCRTVFNQSFTAYENDLVRPGLKKRCLEAAQAWIQNRELLDELEMTLNRPPASVAGTDSGVSSRSIESRLVRVQIEVEHVPHLALTCAFKQDRRGRRRAPFDLHFFGSSYQFDCKSVPRVWTWRATSWLVLTGFLGVVMGRLAARWLGVG